MPNLLSGAKPSPLFGSMQTSTAATRPNQPFNFGTSGGGAMPRPSGIPLFTQLGSEGYNTTPSMTNLMGSMGSRASSPMMNLGSTSPTLPSSQKAPPSQQPQPASTSSTVNPTYNQNLVTPGGIGNSTSGVSLPSLLSQTAQTAQGNLPIGQNAANIAGQYSSLMAPIVKGMQGQITGDLTTGTAPVGEGNAAIAAQAGGAELQGLASAEQQALAGTGQQLTAQDQATKGLQGVAGLAPSALQYGAFGASNLSPQNTIPSLAQQVQQGLISPSDAQTIANSIYPGAGSTMLNQALQGGGYNYNVGAGTSQAQQQNTATAGTAGTQAAATGLGGAVQDYNSLYGAAQSAQTQASQLQNVLAQTGLNSGVPAWNNAINTLGGQLGSDKVAALTAAIQETQAMYSQALSARGITPTASTQQALATLDPKYSASQINSSIEQLNMAMFNALQGQATIVHNYTNNLGSGANTSSNNGQSNPTGWY